MSPKAKKAGAEKSSVQKSGGSPWPKRLMWFGGTALIVGLVAVVF